MLSATETSVDEPPSHCATENNTKLMNRLSSVPATGEAMLTPFVVNPKKTPGPWTLSPAAVYELYIVLYIQNICPAHMASPEQKNLKALLN